MHPALRNTIAVIAGVVALVAGKYIGTSLGNALIPPPGGVDLTTIDGFKAAIPLFTAAQWMPAFFEHALGSLLGAAVAASLAASHKTTLALGIGALHMVGGVVAAVLLPFPGWVVALDLLVMYLPMAWLGGRLVSRP